MTKQQVLDFALRLSEVEQREVVEALVVNLKQGRVDPPSFSPAGVIATDDSRPAEDKEGESPPDVFRFVLPRKGAEARAHLHYPRMVVLKGSTVAAGIANAMPGKYRQLREWLIETGVIAERKGQLVFTRDKSFTNPSVAACIIEGGSRSGHESWRDAGGRTLHELGFARW